MHDFGGDGVIRAPYRTGPRRRASTSAMDTPRLPCSKSESGATDQKPPSAMLGVI
jgi:hypothetical protein